MRSVRDNPEAYERGELWWQGVAPCRGHSDLRRLPLETEPGASVGPFLIVNSPVICGKKTTKYKANRIAHLLSARRRSM